MQRHGASRDEAGRLTQNGGETAIDPNAPVVNGRYRATHLGNALLTRGLLVIVGPEAFPCTVITELSGRGQSTGIFRRTLLPIHR